MWTRVGELGAGVGESADDAPLGVAGLGVDVVELRGAAVANAGELCASVAEPRGADIVGLRDSAVARVHKLCARVADAGERALTGVAVLRLQLADVTILQAHVHKPALHALLDVPCIAPS